MHKEIENRQSQRNRDRAPLANTGMVYSTHGVTDRQTDTHSTSEESSVSANKNSRTSFEEPINPDGMSCIRKLFREQGFSESTTNIIMCSWKSGTKKQYNTFIKRWLQHCCKNKVSSIQPSLNQVLEFLTQLFETGLGYSSLNTARGALSALGIKLDGILAGSNPVVIRFMRGIYNLRPSQPRYTHTWDVSKVLDVLRKLSPVKSLSFKDLTLKLTMLIALTCSARTQSIHLLNVHSVKKFSSEFVFQYDDLVKQSRPGYTNVFVHMKAYPPDRRICIYTVMKEYLKRSSLFRGKSSKLLLSYNKPHKEVSKDTVARWIKIIISRAGIDTKQFSAHSVRSAATSKAKQNSVPIVNILEKAGWSNVKTFARFYDKQIITEDKFVTGIFKK